MNLIKKIKDLFNRKIKVTSNVNKSSVYLHWNFRAEYYKIFFKIKNKYIEHCITYDSCARIDFLPVGISVLKIAAYINDEKLSESDDITLKIDTLEINYAETSDNLHLFWNKTGSTNGYKIYKKSGDALFSNLKEVKFNEAYLYGIPNEAEFKVKPYKITDGEKSYKKHIGKIKFNKGERILSSDKNFGLISIPQKSFVSLVWKPVANANSYKIYQKNGENFEVIDTVSTNHCLIKNLPFDNLYFGIRAFKDSECIANSYILKTKPAEMEVFPVNIDNKIYLHWTKIPNIDGYRIYRKNSKGVFSGFKNVTEEEVYIDNVSPGEFCEFKIKPYNMIDNKMEFTPVTSKCKVRVYETTDIMPVINPAYGNKMAISWIFEGDVDGFEIYSGETLIKDTKDGLSHIEILDYSEDKFFIKGYKIVKKEKIYTCTSKKISVLSPANRFNTKFNGQYKISVIIPSYNSQDYISRSISTVIASDFKELELIVVDDGSKDDTKKIIEWYCKTYPDYVKKIFKQNGGVADARNHGIAKASGTYITFMDNDDMIRPGGYSALYNAIKKTYSDIAIAPLYRIDSDNYVPRHLLKFAENKAHDIDDYLKLIYSDGYNNIGVWNKLYKTSIVKEHPFGLLAYEDVSWTPCILSWADKFCYVHKICYEWDRKIRPETFSHVLSNRTAKEKFNQRYEAFKFFVENGNPKRKDCLYYIMAKRLYNQGKTAQFEEYFNAIRQISPHLINNKYLKEDEKYSKILAEYL